MEKLKSTSLAELRASLSSSNRLSEIDSDDLCDPITAYFKQRCGRFSRAFQKCRESDGGSSIGLIDIDNISLFGENEDENLDLRFSENLLDQVPQDCKKSTKDPDNSEDGLSEVQTELDKQRALAQLALERLSCQTNNSQYGGTVCTPEKKENTVLTDISSKLMNMKLSLEKKSEKDWFEPNFSPNTPRYFNDELSSFGGDDENLPVVDKLRREQNKKRESQYAKKVNSILKELSEIPAASDVTFESQTEEEQINRFEEDEKKFKLENAGVLHNSQISQFSGIDGEESSQWIPEHLTDKPETLSKSLSIGQFFNIRSNRISSLIGSVTNDKSSITSEPQSEISTLNEAQAQSLSKSECSFPLEEPTQPKELKFRRCVSTLDLKNPSETTSNMRYSSDSCSSNSTTMIQDILAEMESGLSGTQIYEKLMKSYGKKKDFKNPGKNEKLNPFSGNNETPKSSKNTKIKDLAKNKQIVDSSKESKKLKPQNSLTATDKEVKENISVRDIKFNETIPSNTIEKIRKRRGSKGFFASTPKNQASKAQNDNFKNDCGKALMDNEDWEPPRIASIQTIDLSKTIGSDEVEKTIIVNSSSSSSEVGKKNSTIVIHDTLSIEDTITAGDLTVLSQRIEEMKQDSVCIVRSAEPEEPVLLTVIQKLADLPKGTLDCSALTPLLRDQFPELLTNFPTPKNSSVYVSSSSKNLQDALVALPGFWAKMPGVWGLKQKIYACADLQKAVLIPVENVSSKWLLISLESLELVHPQGKKLRGVKKNNEFCVMDFVSVLLKDTILPPNDTQSLKIFLKSKLATKLELMLTFEIKELISEETQKRNLRLLVTNVHPENYINVFPNDSINFGVIADQCYDVRNVQVSFEGICELPLTVYIEEDESLAGHFCLSTANQPEKKLTDNMLHHLFHEGEKQVLDLKIAFNPNVLLKDDGKTKDFKAILVLMLDNTTDTDGILRKIPIKGSVGVAKFLNISNCNPLVFRASEKGQLVTRSYSFKNVGSIPIAFAVSIVDAEGETLDGDDAFLFPETFYLSRNEESDMNITFNARASQHFVKRYLKYQIKPNGRITYEVELIGIITTLNSRPLSRTSGVSVSVKSLANGEAGPARLLTTLPSLSWAAVPLEKESRQAFQIKSLATADVSIRVSFDRNVDAFKLINENGEKVQKLRKILKPDCPCVLTVVFRPDVVGTHNNILRLEGNLSEFKKKVPLNGIGGVPNLTIKNVKTDLNNCKILRLQYSRVTNTFESEIEFKNEGRITAFVLLKVGVKEFSLNHDLIINPTSVVIPPDSSVTISFSQKLRNNDFQQLLSDREICKIATILVLSGDEPSRQRIKKLVECEKLQPSERIKLFTDHYKEEKEMELGNFNDSHVLAFIGLEVEFLKSLKVMEMAVVVEKNAEIGETTILEDSSDDFVSFISYKTVIPSRKSRQPSESGSSAPPKSVYSNPVEINATVFSVDSLQSVPTRGRITKWLETLDGV